MAAADGERIPPPSSEPSRKLSVKDIGELFDRITARIRTLEQRNRELEQQNSELELQTGGLAQLNRELELQSKGLAQQSRELERRYYELESSKSELLVALSRANEKLAHLERLTDLARAKLGDEAQAAERPSDDGAILQPVTSESVTTPVAPKARGRFKPLFPGGWSTVGDNIEEVDAAAGRPSTTQILRGGEQGSADENGLELATGRQEHPRHLTRAAGSCWTEWMLAKSRS